MLSEIEIFLTTVMFTKLRGVLNIRFCSIMLRIKASVTRSVLTISITVKKGSILDLCLRWL